MRALTIAAVDLRRLFRQRANLFFLVVLPMMIILLLGRAFGGGDRARIGVASAGSGPLGAQLVGQLDAAPSVDLRRYDSSSGLTRAVEHGEVQAGVIVPSGYDAALRAGRSAHVSYLARPDTFTRGVRSAVDAAVSDQATTLTAARLLERERLASFAAGIVRARAAARLVPVVAVRVRDQHGRPYRQPGGQFQQGATTQLVLFVFLTSLTGAAALMEARREGIARRILATPTSMRELVGGLTLGRFAIAATQAAIIVLGAVLVFGVGFGPPLAVIAVIGALCLAGAGAGMLLGATSSSEEQLRSVSLLLGLGLAALGGSMAPLEVFPPVMKTIAHVTPHAWANDAFVELTRHGGGLSQVAGDVGVLVGAGIVLLALAVWRLRSTLTV